MEKNKKHRSFMDEHHRRDRVGKRMFGLFLIAAGVLYGVQTAGTELPEWLLTWQMLLISIGVIGTVSNRFRPGGWIVPILVGLFFILDEYSNIENIRDYLIPAVLVIIGLMVLFFRTCSNWGKKHKKGSGNGYSSTGKFDLIETSEDSQFKVDASFSSVQKTVVNNDLKGGEINCRFGGCEINLLHSDIQENATISLNCRLGGVKLIVPSNWLVESEVAVTMGSVEDKRVIVGDADPNKVLVLKGNVVMAGVEITSS